jgi:short-subunit dehydrogenase
MCYTIHFFLRQLNSYIPNTTLLVNFFGMVRCCKAFIPVFKDQVINETHFGGRILNITSMAGLISNGCIGFAPYVASKHAANAFSHFLRTELLSSFHIQVTTINPSFHKTPLVDTMGDVYTKQWDQLEDKVKMEYGEKYFERVREICVDIPQSLKWDMNVVIEQVVQCLRMKYIPPEIIIGTDAKYALLLLRMLPSYIIDFIFYYNFPPIPAIMKKR